MRIVQMLPTLSYGDAVGNECISIYKTLQSLGIATDIYAENIDRRYKTIAKSFTKYVDSKDNVILFHLSIGSKLSKMLSSFQARIIFRYHNVTPAHFFEGYDTKSKELCENGLEAVKSLSIIPDFCITDSKFNKKDLIELGYTCPIEVMPILIKFDDYEQQPNDKLVTSLKDDGKKNVFFVGRVVPNKKQEDIVKSFYYYHKYMNKDSHLYIVGSGEKTKYGRKLTKYIEELGLSDAVTITGHVPFADILAYYHGADLLVCMSEHEGFCVPLVEAMYFNVPIIAYDSSAIAETLGGSGLLLEDKNPKFVAEAINYVLTNDDYRNAMLEKEKERLKDFDNAVVTKRFLEILKQYNIL